MGRRSFSSGRKSYGKRSGFTKVSSRRTTGVFASSGAPVRNVEAYTAAGGKTFTPSGTYVRNPKAYAQAVQTNSIQSAARRAGSQNPRAKAYSYNLELEGGKHYVGMTTNPSKRLADHVEGHGAKATQDKAAVRVSITPHTTVQAAKKAETRMYYQTKDKHGMQNVRGAGHTKRFEK